jgi:Cu/Ag efflux protein CusF
MLKALAVFLSLSLTVLMLAGPALALEDKSSKAHKAGISHVKGDVVSVDQNAKTLTVKKGGLRHKELTFQVDDPALLTNVQTGQSVRVGYVKEGAQMIAKEVVPSTTASKKR